MRKNAYVNLWKALMFLSLSCALPSSNTHGWLAVGILSWPCAKWQRQHYHLKDALLAQLMVRTQWVLKHLMDHWRIMRFGFEPVSSRHASVRVNARGYVSECVCETEKERGILYPVDSYRPLNGSNNVKELQCHIHQSWLSVKSRQRCWHLNTTQWVSRPFKCQLPDT